MDIHQIILDKHGLAVYRCRLPEFNVIKRTYNLLRRIKLNLCNREVQSGSEIWNADISKYVCIGRNVKINGSAIGFASYIGDNSSLVRTKIGKYCSIASNVIVYSF